MYKYFILFLIIAMLLSLFGGAAFLLKDRGTTRRTTYILGVRVSIAILLFISLVYGILSGQIGPNS